MGTITVNSKSTNKSIDHTDGYFYIFEDEVTPVIYNFTNKLATSDTLASPCTILAVDENGVDRTASVITATLVTSPNCSFKVQNTNAGTTYEITVKSNSSSSNVYVGHITLESYGVITLNANLADPNANSYVTLKEANDYIKNVRGRGTKWDLLSIEGKKRVLIEAAKDIDKFNYIDEKYYDVQSLEFPRDTQNVLIGNVATPCTINSFTNSGFTVDSYGGERSYNDFWKYGTVHITSATPLHDIRLINTSNITTDVVTVVDNFTATPVSGANFIAFEPLNPRIKEAQCEQALYILNNMSNDSLTSYSGLAKSVSIDDVSVTFKDGSSSSSTNSSTSKKLLSPWIQRNKRLGRA